MSLSAIINMQEEKLRRENEIFKTIFKRVEETIIYNVGIGAKACIYTIPDFIWGYPLFDVSRTMAYLLYKLNKRGFIPIQIDPINIYITWDLNVIKQKDNERSKVNLNTNIDSDRNDENNEDKKDSKKSIFDVIAKKSSLRTRSK